MIWLIPSTAFSLLVEAALVLTAVGAVTLLTLLALDLKRKSTW